MNIIGNNFNINQYGMKTQMAQLKSLIQFLDPDLCSFLDEKESLNMYFCFRWLLIWFKREFKFEDIKQLWDVLICQPYSYEKTCTSNNSKNNNEISTSKINVSGLPCHNFQLLLAAGILLKRKSEIIDANLSFTDILRFINDLSEQMDVDEVIMIGSQLFDLLDNMRVNEQLPKHIVAILFQDQVVEDKSL